MSPEHETESLNLELCHCEHQDKICETYFLAIGTIDLKLLKGTNLILRTA